MGCVVGNAGLGNQLKELMPQLPNVALVLAAEDIDLEAKPEEGKIGELAAAVEKALRQTAKAEAKEF